MSSVSFNLSRLIDYSRGLFRRTVFRTYRLLKHPRLLKASASRRWFARHFLDKHVWKPTQHTFAGGVAIGLFVTMQLLPMQMPVAAILAALFRVNIPIALAMCWLSNPVTMPALVPLEYAVGKWVLSWISSVPVSAFPRELPLSFADSWQALKSHAPIMLFGGVLIGAVLIPVGYVVTYASWSVLESWSQRRRKRHEANPPPPAEQP
jgi:uncharacterized protein (DUF2062 family)